jgi:hypothetical protein
MLLSIKASIASHALPFSDMGSSKQPTRWLNGVLN